MKMMSAYACEADGGSGRWDKLSYVGSGVWSGSEKVESLSPATAQPHDGWLIKVLATRHGDEGSIRLTAYSSLWPWRIPIPYHHQPIAPCLSPSLPSQPQRND